MQIISISGLDGSGKSTQIQLFKEHFEKDAKKAFYFHAVSFSIANILNKNKKKNSEGKNKDIMKASWIAIQLRKCALFVDILRFRNLLKKLEKDHDYLLTDRYFYDMIVNITYLSKKKYNPFFLHWIPQPNNRLFLNVSPEYIMMRDNPPAQGHDYLRDKDIIFHNYIKQFDLNIVDGSKSQQTVFENILSKIKI